jgi:hypothetical protein
MFQSLFSWISYSKLKPWVSFSNAKQFQSLFSWISYSKLKPWVSFSNAKQFQSLFSWISYSKIVSIDCKHSPRGVSILVFMDLILQGSTSLITKPSFLTFQSLFSWISYSK